MDNIAFKLNKISTQQFAVIDSAYSENNEEFSVETNLGFGVDATSGLIMSLVKIQFEQEKNPFLIVEVACEFDIIEDFWSQFTDSKQIKLPKGLMIHLAMITIGTTRGVLHSKTENTKFNEFLLPTLNVEDMIKEDGLFEK